MANAADAVKRHTTYEERYAQLVVSEKQRKEQISEQKKPKTGLKMKFKKIVLSEIGDYLLEKPEQVEWTEKGLELSNPYVINEDGLAQQIKAERLLITHHVVQGVQEGEFEEETV